MAGPDEAANPVAWSELTELATRVADTTRVPPSEELRASKLKSTTRQVKTGSSLFGLRTRYEDVVEHHSVEQTALGPHWVLDTEEMEWITGSTSSIGSRMDERRITFTYALEQSGQLTKVCDFIYYATTTNGKRLVESYFIVVAFDDLDFRLFDKDKVRRLLEGRNHRDDWVDAYEEVRMGPDQYARGAGLSARLEQLAEASSPLSIISATVRDKELSDGDYASYPASSHCMWRLDTLNKAQP